MTGVFETEDERKLFETTLYIAETARLRGIVDRLVELKRQRATYNAAADKLKPEIAELEAELLYAMEVSGLERIEGTKHKTHISTHTSVKQPQSAEDREAFISWLHSKGMEHLLNVNSNTLVTLYNKELEAALARGEASFSIPGIKDVKTYNKLGITSK